MKTFAGIPWFTPPRQSVPTITLTIGTSRSHFAVIKYHSYHDRVADDDENREYQSSYQSLCISGFFTVVTIMLIGCLLMMENQILDFIEEHREAQLSEAAPFHI